MMNIKPFTGLILMLAFALQPAFSQSFQIDKNIPEVPLNEDTELTVLNSRLGSRFSLSYVARDNGIYTGALGYDKDEFSQLFAGVDTENGKYCFRTANRPEGYQYLKDQKLRVGMNAMQITGNTEDGVTVTLTIVSPYTPSKSLADTADLKTQIVPGFYVLLDVENTSGETVEGQLKTSMPKILVDKDNGLGARQWAHNTQKHELYFRDNASHNTLNVLAARRDKGQYHFNKSGFNGLRREFTLAPNEKTADTLIYATHYKGGTLYDKRTNDPLKFYYLKFWKDLDQVLQYMRNKAERNLQLTQTFENLLMRSNATPKEKWVLAIAFHSDIANSYLLQDKADKPRFYLAEGRFKHMSTVDVAHETELTALFAPWRLRLQLKQWLNYIAFKEVNKGVAKYNTPHVEGISASEYGPFIYHDVGDRPYISNSSDYWFGPHMAVEENCNYALLLYWYWKLTGDDAFTRDMLGTVEMLLHSVDNRDTDGNGIVDMGIGWTTYDGAEALKRSPENVYLAVKQMTAYELAADMFESLKKEPEDERFNYKKMVQDAQDGKDVGFRQYRLPNAALREKQAGKYRAKAKKITETLQKAYDKYGYLPISLDENFEGWDGQSIVLGEGLFIPGITGYTSENLKDAASLLAPSYKKAFAESQMGHSIALATDAEGSSWFSKVFVSDYVAAQWYGVERSTAKYAYDWNINNHYAYNDGVKPNGKEPWIGFWYPRGVSSLVYFFLEENFQATESEAFLKGLK